LQLIFVTLQHVEESYGEDVLWHKMKLEFSFFDVFHMKYKLQKKKKNNFVHA